MSNFSSRDYMETVDDIAKEAVETHPGDDSAQEEFVRESVDGSQYVIYDAGHEVVLETTENEPDPSDVAEMVDPGDLGDWRKVRGTAAFMAMERDALEALDDARRVYAEEHGEED